MPATLAAIAEQGPRGFYEGPVADKLVGGWNGLGGITWATAIGLIAYSLGHSASNAIQAFGLYGLVAVALAIVSGVVMHRRSHGRRTAQARPGDTGAGPSPGSGEPPAA